MHTVKWFQILLFNTNTSIQHYSFIYTLLNGSKYSYLTWIIWFRIHHLHTVKWLQVFLSNTNSFICTVQWLKYYNVTLFNLTWVICLHREQWQWRVTPHFPNLQHYWSLTIKLFCVISRTLGCCYPSTEMELVYSIAPADWGRTKVNMPLNKKS